MSFPLGVLSRYEGETDYLLEPGATSCWITVDNISVYIVRTDEGVVVDLYAKGRESDESLAGTWALNQEAEPGEEEHHTPCGDPNCPAADWGCT